MNTTFYLLLALYISLQIILFLFGTNLFFRNLKLSISTIVILGFITTFLGGIVFLNLAVSLQIGTYKGDLIVAKISFIALILSLFHSLFLMTHALFKLFINTIRKQTI